MKNFLRTVVYGMGALSILGLSPPAWAKAKRFGDECPDVKSCLKSVSRLLGQKYVFSDKQVKGRKVESSGELELNPENAEMLLTNLLYENRLARIPLDHPQTYKIVELREAVQSPIPTVEADKDTVPNLPNTWDLLTLKYRLQNPREVDKITRHLSDFIPRDGRIVGFESGLLVVTAPAPVLRRLLTIMDVYDRRTASNRDVSGEAGPRLDATIPDALHGSREIVGEVPYTF